MLTGLCHTGDVKQVLDLLADDCLEVDAVSGSRKEGKQPIMHMMDGVNKVRALLLRLVPWQLGPAPWAHCRAQQPCIWAPAGSQLGARAGLAGA